MDRASALKLLSSVAPMERTRAARYLAEVGKKSDVAALKSRYSQEHVSYVKRAITYAIERISAGKTSLKETGHDIKETEIGSENDSYHKAVEFVSGVFSHEIEPKVGLIKTAARAMLGETYQGSDLQEKIRSLDLVLKAIEKLRSVSKISDLKEINLRALVEEIVAELTYDYPVQLIGNDDFALETDPELLKLAIKNGLVNGIEASIEAGTRKPVVISWGETEAEYYLTILDCGLGVSGPVSAAFELGKTTKKNGHTGFGLSISRAAMNTLSGSANLFPSQPSRMSFELRWFK